MAERIRGSIDVPLDARGTIAAREIGRRFAAAQEPIDALYSSPLRRTRVTAREIGKERPEPALAPWSLGAIEGESVRRAAPILTLYSTLAPSLSLPGRSPESTRDGEPFDSFRERTLSFVSGLRDGPAGDDRAKVVLVTHHRVLRLVDAWLRRGAPDDLAVDIRAFNDYPGGKSEDAPGDIYRLGDRRIERIDGVPKGPGIYLVRHGETVYNIA